jgi:DNA primase
VDYAVAPLGTALTRDQLQLVLRAVPEVVLAFDGDEAGRDAAWRSVDTALPELSKGHLIRFLFLPEGEDPDSLVQREGGDAFRARQDQATPLLDFLLDGLQQRVDLSHTDGRARLVELARPYFAKLPEGPLRTLYVQRLAGPTGLRPEDLSRELSRGEARSRQRQEAAKSGTPARSSAGPVAGRARRSVVRQALILLLANPYELAEDTLAYREDLLASDEAGVNLLVRDEPYGEALARLAGADPEVLPEDQRTEFKGCLRRLRSRAIQARIDHLLAEAQAGRLPNEQLSEIHELKRQREALDRPAH